MKPGGGNAKGKAFERRVANAFIDAGFANARRGLDQPQQGRQPDVEGTPFWPECKDEVRPNPWKALQQGEAALRAHPGADQVYHGGVVAVTKALRKPVLVTMRLETFLQLAKSYQDAVNGDVF